MCLLLKSKSNKIYSEVVSCKLKVVKNSLSPAGSLEEDPARFANAQCSQDRRVLAGDPAETWNLMMVKVLALGIEWKARSAEGCGKADLE